MANKLYYKYGTVNSSKSANFLMIRHNYLEQGFSVWCGKPEIDDRDGVGVIATRAGLKTADAHIIKTNTKFSTTSSDADTYLIDADIVMIDECQFLTKEQIDNLFIISREKPVLCFGLLTDYKQELFEGSKRLIELAESVEKIKTVCRCGKAANYTIRIHDGIRVINGPQILIGGNETYQAVCKECMLKYDTI